MLATFTLKDFKSFREARLPLGPLTVLIGANAAGKSNAIEALRLLSWLAQGQKLSAIQYAVNSADRVVRGRVEDLCHRGQSQFGLGCVTDDPHWNRLDMQISIRDGELHISAEKIDAVWAAAPLYDMDQPSTGPDTDAGVGYNNFLRGSKRPHVLVSDQMAVFAQFIPMAAIVEVGNHIAQVRNGALCRAAAERFMKEVRAALADEAPWKPINFPTNPEVLAWLDAFPDSATQGIGMGDLSIKKEWEELCRRHPLSRIWVWTLDNDLTGLDRRIRSRPAERKAK